ncbi:MAG: 30S ribosomal protein S17 [Crenarchaeota archaeon]|nr:30S ribosomal protein S17 [Thermoproteota archaeon]
MSYVPVYELPTRPKPGEEVVLPTGQRVVVRHVGIPWIAPPRKVCLDYECPWHGHLKVRGVVLEVKVVKVHPKFVVTQHEWLKYDPKYKRYEWRRKKIHARLPPCIDVKPGDIVYIGETRPLSKTISFVVLGTKNDVVPVKPIVKRLGETEDLRV